ncbi:MAG: sigma-54-dependent Fis family transcriptional regulator, partial [Spirochaetes bacterium]|nr:sigma-54-dependent Fis family transcriptional regulator [Spirochaetota bacterium]
REDLYYRLNVIPFYVPALRERKEDIPLFINFFIKKLSQENKVKEKRISKEALDYMKEYSWPGNVRQLQNIIERLNVMVPGDEITLEHAKKYLDEESIKILDDNINSKYEKYKLNVARDEFEKDFIEKKLRENDFNISKTAKTLGVYPSNLYSKINKLGINIEEIKK